MVEMLADADFEIIGANTRQPSRPSNLANVYIIDLNALDDTLGEKYLNQAARNGPLLLAGAESSANPSRYAHPSRSYALSLEASMASLADMIHAVAGDRDPSSGTPAEQLSSDEPRPISATLSRREVQVLRKIAQGLTHAQVARRLGISRHTVDSYMNRIRMKLGPGNKAELTRAAVLAGLVV